MSYSVPQESLTKANLDDTDWGTGANEIRIDNSTLQEAFEKTQA